MKKSQLKQLVTETVLDLLNKDGVFPQKDVTVNPIGSMEENEEPKMPEFGSPEYKALKAAALRPIRGKHITQSDLINKLKEKEPQQKVDEDEGGMGKLTSDQQKEIEQKIRNAMETPGYRSFTFGTNRGGNKATVGAEINGSTETLYELPYEYAKELHKYADELRRKIGDKKWEKRFPQTQQKLNPDDVFKNLQSASKLDWFYQKSDDPGVFQSGQKRMNNLRSWIEKAATIDPNKTKEIVKKVAPQSFHDQLNKLVDNVVRKKL